MEHQNRPGWLGDANRFRVADQVFAPQGTRRPPPRHGPGEPFLKGPIPYAWVARACRLPGCGLHVATTYRHLCDRFQRPNRSGLDAIADGLQISPDTVSRSLQAAEEAGLLLVRREPGRKLLVSVVSVPDGSDHVPRPLYGPVPWDWWLTALRLEGPALRVATACWLAAGWERSAEFEFPTGDWPDLGLSRFAAGRGLNGLQRAGLVNVLNRPGRSALVTLRAANKPSTLAPDDLESGATRESVG